MNDDADAKSRIALGGLGTILAAAGVGVVSPGLKDAVIARLNRSLQLGLYLEAPPWAGLLMIVAGGVLLLTAFVGQSRIERALIRVTEGRGSSIRTFLAIKHVGFAPVVRDIRRGELPADLTRRDIRHLGIDLCLELGASSPQVEAAIAAYCPKQSQRLARVAGAYHAPQIGQQAVRCRVSSGQNLADRNRPFLAKTGT
jgi:hypothetical protein